MAAGQPASERVALGAPAGNEPKRFTFPPVIMMLFISGVPSTENDVGSCFTVVFLPWGGFQWMIKAELGIGGGSAEPLKIVAQLLAAPGTLKSIRCIAILPMTMFPAGGIIVVVHWLPTLPKCALTSMVSKFATPPDLRGGRKWTVPCHTPAPGAQVTLPGKIGHACATPDSTVTKRRGARTSAARMRTVFRAM
jgi:hypothetical protein